MARIKSTKIVVFTLIGRDDGGGGTFVNVGFDANGRRRRQAQLHVARTKYILQQF